MTLYIEAASEVSRARQLNFQVANKYSKIFVMNDLGAKMRALPLHFILPHLVGVEVLEPLAYPL